MPIVNEDEFYAEKAQLIAEKEAAEKRYQEVQTQTQELALEAQLSAAYAESGGIGNDTDREAYEAIKRHLKDGKLQFENGQPVFVDDKGLIELGNNGPKTIGEKVQELKRHPTFKHFFSAEADNRTDQPTGPQTYTREQAIKGKVNINDIASGKIQMEGTQPGVKPDAKVVSASEVAKLKGRRWN